jgi:microcystin degradation protein MlrC
MKRVGILGFQHESNTFLAEVPGTYDLFESVSLHRGPALIEAWRDTAHELGGFIRCANEANLALVPCMATYAMPCGAITSETFERISGELLESVQASLPLDGLLVALHGAAVSEAFPDAEGELLRRLRDLVGPHFPIIATLDLHANVSVQMAASSTALVGYRTNPHIDQAQRGCEAVALLVGILSGKTKPIQALETPPLLIEICKQYTNEQPARGLYEDLDQVLGWPGILSASVTLGYPYSDVPEMGAAFIAVADGDTALAKRAARWMANRAWERRATFVGDLPTPESAVEAASKSIKRPVVLMDIGDNVGGGSAADSTILFAEILKQRATNALVILCDPESVEACLRAGVRNSVQLSVGGKIDDRHGTPVAVQGRVRTLSDGQFVETQVRHGGWRDMDQGVTAVVETDNGHTVVLTSRRLPPVSLEQLLSLGIHPEQKSIIIAKGVVAPRAAYEPIAGEIMLVDTPGVTANSPFHFTYKNRRIPLFPLEPEAVY